MMLALAFRPHSFRFPSARLAASAGLAGALAFAGCRPSAPPSPDGAAVIAAVLPGGGGEAADLRPGDRVLALHRKAAPPANPRAFDGAISTCLDLALWELDEAPRGEVDLEIERGAAGAATRSTVHVVADDWRVRCRPEHPKTPAARAWESLRRAQELADAHETPKLEKAFAAAERQVRALKDERLLAYLLQRRGEAWLGAEELDAARADFQAALAIRRRLAPGSLSTARTWALLGRAESMRQDIPAADAALAEAVKVQQAAAPGSLALAFTENVVGSQAALHGDEDAADRHYRAALAIARAKLPESHLVGALLMNLGNIARHRSRYDEAEDFQNRALAHFKRHEPDSLSVSDVRLNLGIVSMARGNYEASEGRLRAALADYRKRLPGTPAVAIALANLGLLEMQRANYAEAEADLLEALALYGQLAPDSPMVARAETNLTTVCVAQGAFDRAEKHAARSLAIHRKLGPPSPILAYDLVNAAEIARSRGDARGAKARIAEALAIDLAHPPTADVAYSLLRASYLALELGDLATADRADKAALAIVEKVVPGSNFHADALDLRGRIEQRRGRTEAASRSFSEALDVYDRTVERVGGSDLDRTRFRSQFADLARTAMALQIERGQPEEAFRTLERFRARSLLALLAERDLAPPRELSRELAEEKRRIDAALAQADDQIEGVDPAKDGRRLDEMLGSRARLLAERERLIERIRRAAPRYAALTAPSPLALAAARRTLDPGTVWLDYSVADGATTLFVVLPEGFPGAPPSGLAVRAIPLGRAKLASEVTIFRSLVLAGERASGPAAERALRAAAERLYARLVAPAEPWLGHADRLVISPDGPLSALPFAALALPAPAGGYLAERWPFSTVPSATLAAELRRERARPAAASPSGTAALPGATPLVAFGDPRYPAPPPGAASRGTAAGGEDRGLDSRPWLRFRSGLAPLPDSRAEVEGIASLFPPARAFLGADATEARFLNDAPQGRIVHFAGHALLDPRFPLDSGLALTPPARSARPGDDGLLQSWEIFENLRLAADLVTLSACETGLGPEAQGEGLLGLTRAFHYAGARTVLSSLWSVSDRSTAELMRRFYGHLKAGEPKDRALAAAQRELIHGGLAHPYHWAAFQLDGDWR